MEYASFARSDRRVSRLCFGAMGLNCAFGRYDERDLIHAVLRCLERGVTMIDTARTYADSEAIVGKALKEWKGARPFIASKAAPQGLPTNNGWGIPNPIEISYPRGAVTRSVETSLRALDVDCIDLMQLHQYWAQYDDADYWLEELEALKSQGKIRYVGISCTDHRSDGAISLVRSGRIDSVQTIVNIFDPLAFDSLVPVCQRNRVAVIARCVLDEGGLTGFLNEATTFDDVDFRENYFRRGPLAEYVRRVEALRSYIPRAASSLADLALRFVLHHPGITTANVSLHIPEHADEDIAAVDKPPLPDDVFEELRRKHRWLMNLYEEKYFPRAEGEEVSATGFKTRARE